MSALLPHVKVIGVQAERAPALAQSLSAGRLLSTDSADTFAGGPHEMRFRRAELLQASGIDAELLDEAEQYGLIVPAQGSYTEADVVIAKTLGDLAGFGLGPRHLRAFRSAADREVGLVEQIVEPLRRRRDVGAAARAEEAEHHVASLSVVLHAMLVKNGLRRRG
jgi:hypothetical protein